MRQIPVRTDDLSFTVANPAAPVLDYDAEGRPQRVDETGRRLWQLELLVTAPEGMSIERVKLASASEPDLAPRTPVRVEGLVAVPYVSNGRAMVSLRATAVTATVPAAGPGKA